MNLNIAAVGPFVTVQDLGRFVYQRFGVPTSGAMDGLAIRAANELVRNSWDAACLEIGLGDLTAIPDSPCLIALTGRGVALMVNERPMPLSTAIYVRSGWEIHVERLDWGWAYLAVGGGINVPIVLGSRSTYVRGGFGGFKGRPLQTGDVIHLNPSRFGIELAGRKMTPPEYPDELTADVILGPQADRFTEAGVGTFLSSEYAITQESDRMGYRLTGQPVAHTRGADVVSDGIVLGTVQIPSSGQPILMMADHATTGGYTKIVTLTGLDTWRAAQCPPGKGKVRFRAITVEAAQAKHRLVLGDLKARVDDFRDEGEFMW